MASKRNRSLDSFKRYCSAYGCLNRRMTNDSEISFFKIPDDAERRQEWLTAIDREDILDERKIKKAKTNYVCSAHFDESTIVTTFSRRLKGDAVPTKLLPHKAQKNIQPDAHPQTSKGTSSAVSKKDISVSTYSHSQTQTVTQVPKPILLLENEIKSEIDPDNIESKVTTSTQTHLNVTSNKTTQTTSALCHKSPCKRKLEKDIDVAKCKRKRLQQEILKIEKELKAKNAALLSDPEDEVAKRFLKLVEWQNKIKNKCKDNRYDAEYKMFALNLHFASPHAYRCLQTILKLPSKSTLHRLKLKIPPKLDEHVLNSLSLKMKSLPDNAKYCTICVDEMVLKRNLYYDTKNDEIIGFHNINGSISSKIASNAYVIMLQGIYCNWEQPIAYALIGSTTHYAELDSWINEVILKLFSVGIEVKAIISDQDSNFDKYAKVTKNVTVDKPYFFVDEHKIFYIFDVPHLLKCVRNDLMSSDFYCKEAKISWDHIAKLYDHQKDKNLRLIPKITCAHIKPNNFQRLKVVYAAQIFSNAISAALETYIDFGIMAEEARGTAKFIKIMDDLFDVLNSSKTNSPKKYRSALKMSIEQKLLLQDALHMFATIKSTSRNTQEDNTDQMKTFHNFQITIQSVLQLFEDLKSEGFKYLFTRRLNKDRLENFFRSVIQQGGACSELTPSQFTRTFSKLFYVNMLKSDQVNCETDIYEILLRAEDIIDKESLNPSNQARPSLLGLSGEIDYRVDLPEANALTYVAGLLLYKCSQKHSSCKEISEMLNSSPNLDHSLLTHHKTCNKNESLQGDLKMAPRDFSQYVEKLDSVFTHNFEYYINENPGSKIFKLLQEIELPTLPCSCFPVDYLLKFFVRLRIYSTLKFNNRNFKTGGMSINQYLKLKQL